MTVVTQHLQRWKSAPKKAVRRSVYLFVYFSEQKVCRAWAYHLPCIILFVTLTHSLCMLVNMTLHFTACLHNSLLVLEMLFAPLSSHPHTLTSLTSPSSSSSSSLSSSAYQFSTVDCTVSLLSSLHTHVQEHTHLETVKVSTCTGRGATSPSLSLPLSLLVSLQSWAAGAAEAESRESSNSRSVRHRQRDRPADSETGTQTDWQTTPPDHYGLDQDNATRLRMRQENLASVFWGDSAIATWNNRQPIGRFNPVLPMMEYLHSSLFLKFLLSSSSPFSSSTSSSSSSHILTHFCWRCARLRLLRTSIATATDSARAL